MSDVTKEFDLVDLNDLVAKIPDKPLNDSDIRVDLIKGKVDYAPDLRIRDFSFSIGTNTIVSIEGFNSIDDIDSQGVLGKKKNEHGTNSLDPQLILGSDAWLKYSVKALVKANAVASASFAEIDCEGEKSVIMSDYHVHKLNDNTRNAILSDLSNMRFASRGSDIKKLNVNDAMAYQVRAKLNTTLEVSWADMFTSNLNALTNLLDNNTLLSIKTSLGAKFSATVSLVDDFILIFSCPAQNKIRIAVQKGVSRSNDISADVGISVEFEDPKFIQKILAEVIEGITCNELKDIDNLFSKASFEDLSVDQKVALALILDRLQLGDIEERLDELKLKWDNLKEEIESTIHKMAISKVSAGFRYEYQRIDKTSTLLQVLMNENDARNLHEDLIKCDVAVVIRWLRDNPEKVTVENYLHQKSLSRARSMGFTLGIENWKVASLDKTKLECVLQENFEGSQRVAYTGLRAYDAEIWGNRATWSADLKADTSHFSKKILASDLYYGFYLCYVSIEKSLSEDELRQVIDQAIVWSVLDEADEEEVFSQVGEYVKKGLKVETNLELKFNDQTFRTLIPLVCLGNLDLFSRALARAMPWWKISNARKFVDVRERLYAPLWQSYMKNPSMSSKEAALRAYSHLRYTKDGKNLSNIEGDWLLARENIYTFAGCVEKNSKTYTAWKNFLSGMRLLQNAFNLGWEHTIMKEVFYQIQGLCAQSHHVRALGTYLLTLAASTPAGLDNIERTFTIRIPQKDQQIVFSTSQEQRE